MACTSFIMASCGSAPHKTLAMEQSIVAMVLLFMFFFNVGWGCVWVLCSELATGRNRGKLMSVSTGSNWFWNWLVSFTFPYLFNADSAGLGPKIGFIYGCLMLCAVGWVWLFFYRRREGGVWRRLTKCLRIMSQRESSHVSDEFLFVSCFA
jgi:MFS transporter, SP family, sugar:H+ symporter